MPTVDQILAIVGAAEGSFYSVGRSIDVRYRPSFANDKSGLSFGTFQFDVATNTQGQIGFRNILRDGVAAKAIDKAASDRFYARGSTRNAGAFMKAADKDTVTTLFSTATAKSIIDSLDRRRAVSEGANIETMISQAALVWGTKKVIAAPIFTSGQTSHLRLFAYLLANLNRYPANQSTFQKWLQGETVKTLNAPVAGFQLAAPPTIDQMHTFFQSLRIWDGTQGKYQFLRDRLDPTLDRLLK